MSTLFPCDYGEWECVVDTPHIHIGREYVLVWTNTAAGASTYQVRVHTWQPNQLLSYSRVCMVMHEGTDRLTAIGYYQRAVTSRETLRFILSG